MADLDGDGRSDLLSGSWPGEIFVFRRQADGGFGERDHLRMANGRPLKVGRATAAFATDWRGTGQLDLIVGVQDGSVFLVPNDGKPGWPTFGTPVRLSAGGTAIEAPEGDAGPCVADWDLDGRPDLLVGAGDGSVRWYRNVGSKTEPKLDAGRLLLGPANDARSRSGTAPGKRTKVCVTDWNGDGLPDLLVGDYANRALDRTPNDADRDAVTQARARSAELMKSYQELALEIVRLARPVPGETPQDRSEREQQLRAARVRQPALLEEVRALQQVRVTPGGAVQPSGNVWLLLRKPG